MSRRLKMIVSLVVCLLAIGNISSNVYGSTGFCNRLMAAVARALGNPTEEFKRRIAFLLETGHIADEHLSRMLVSDKPVSPFGAGHIAADLMPHETAMERLIGDKTIDWKEIKRFIEELRTGFKETEKAREVHDKETEALFYPFVIATLQAEHEIRMTPVLVKKNKHVYLRIWTKGSDTYLADAVTGEIIQSAGKSTYYELSSPVTFRKKGVDYAIAGTLNKTLQDPGILVVDALTRKVVKKMKMGDTLHGYVSVFEEDRVFYVVAGSSDHSIYVFDALRGRLIQQIPTDGLTYPMPAVIEKEGLHYLVMESADGFIQVVDAITGDIAQKIKLARGEVAESTPAVFEKDGTHYIATACQDAHIRVYEAFTGKLVQNVELSNRGLEAVTIFKKDGVSYLVVSSRDGNVYVLDALAGRVVQKIATGGEVWAKATVFEKDGEPYIAVGSDDQHVYVAGALTGNILRKIKTDGTVHSSPLVYERDGRMFMAFGSDDAKLYIIQLYGPIIKEEKK